PRRVTTPSFSGGTTWIVEKKSMTATSAKIAHFHRRADPAKSKPSPPPDPPPPKLPRPFRSSSSSAEGPRGRRPRPASAGSGVTHGLRGPGFRPPPFPSSPSLGPLLHGLFAIRLIESKI